MMRPHPGGGWLAPAALVLAIGGSDTLFKLFQETNRPAERGLFLFSIFTTALLVCLAILAVRGRSGRGSIRAGDLLAGLALGVPNQLSSLFMVQALVLLPAAIAFPLSNIAIMALTSLLGVRVWGERLRAPRLGRHGAGAGLGLFDGALAQSSTTAPAPAGTPVRRHRPSTWASRPRPHSSLGVLVRSGSGTWRPNASPRLISTQTRSPAVCRS